MTVSVVRTVILYLLLMAAVRIMGKRQIGELQPSELVVTMLLSDLAAVPMQENGLPLLNGVLPILVLVALELFLSGIMLKCPAIGRLIGGTPQTVIRDGHIDAAVMRRLRMTVEDLSEALRQQNIFDLSHVQYAVVETGGQISAYLYPRYQPATAADVKADNPDEGMPIVVVSDGQLCHWGLRLCGLSEEQVAAILRRHRCKQQDVFLLTATKTGQHHLVTQRDAKGGVL